MSGNKRHHILVILVRMMILLVDDVEVFSGSQADLESAADNYFLHLHVPNPYVSNLCL